MKEQVARSDDYGFQFEVCLPFSSPFKNCAAVSPLYTQGRQSKVGTSCEKRMIWFRMV